MSSIVGRGRYATRTYPTFGGNGGGAPGPQGPQGPPGPTGPDYSATALVAAGSPPATAQAIPLDDNATTRIVINASARDDAGNWYGVESYTRWTRTAGGAATLLGVDTSPPDANNIANLVGISLVGSGNNVNVVYEGSSSVPTRYDIRVWLISIPLASA